MPNRPSRVFWAKCALFATAVLWGASFFIIKDTLDVFSPVVLIAIRMTAGVLLMLPLFFKKLRSVTRVQLRKGFFIGLFLFLAYVIQTMGLQRSTPGKGAFLTAIYCVIVPFQFWAVNRTRPERSNYLAALFCITGIGLVSLTEQFTVSVGDALLLGGGFFFAAHCVAVAHLAKGEDPVVITTLQFLFAALFAWPIGLLTEGFPAAFPAESLLGLFYCAVVATGLGTFLQNLGQKYVSPSSASLILSLESVFGVLLSVLFYGERLTVRMVLGFVLIALAVLISEKRLFFSSKHSTPPHAGSSAARPRAGDATAVQTGEPAPAAQQPAARTEPASRGQGPF